MLEVRDLHLHYGGIQAVKGISFDVACGELLALIGGLDRLWRELRQIGNIGNRGRDHEFPRRIHDKAHL